jgi:hypothetical protein
MSERGDIESTQQTPPFPEHVSAIFERLDASDVEHFYKSYQLWTLQRRIEILQIETELLQQAIADNDELQQQVRPSAIVLASLAQFQASGVDDINLLDRMLERGEDWLDHTIQLLRHCEDLDVIGSNYTQWCEHALEGAYDWIESMKSIENDAAPVDTQPRADTVTEEQLLQKLMSEDEQTEKLPAADGKSKGTIAIVEEIALPLAPTPEWEIEEATEPALIGATSEPREITVDSDTMEIAEIVPIDENVSAPVEIPEMSADSATAEIEETVPIDEHISALAEIPEISTDSATAEIEEIVPIDDSAQEETVAVEDEPAVANVESDNSPTMKRPALTNVQIAEAVAVTTEQTEQVDIEILESEEETVAEETGETKEVPVDFSEITHTTEVVEPTHEEVLVEETDSVEETPQDAIAITHYAEKARQEGAEEKVPANRPGIASAAVSAREERPVPQVRQGGLWRFLRRLLALFWHA